MLLNKLKSLPHDCTKHAGQTYEQITCHWLAGSYAQVSTKWYPFPITWTLECHTALLYNMSSYRSVSVLDTEVIHSGA